ncbi:uncharacterized protein LOC115209445 [Argonauta hians]
MTIICAYTTMLLGSSSILTAGNEILNGDFENINSFSQPLEWKAIGCKLVTSEAIKKSGQRGVVVANRVGYWSGPRQVINGTQLAGKRFIISAWVRLGTLKTSLNKSTISNSLLAEKHNGFSDQKTGYRIEMIAKYKRESKEVYEVIGSIRAIHGLWHQILENHVFPKTISGQVTIFIQGEYGIFPYFDFYIDDVYIKTWKESENWRKEANQLIRKFRQREVELTLEGISWNQMKIEVVQKKLLFAIGSSVTRDLINNTMYKKVFLENFNFATLENEMNWHYNEPEQDEETYEDSDAIMGILKKHDIPVRGHSVFWAQPQMQQHWVRKLTAEQLKYQMKERIQNIMSRYQNKVIHWDVNHEMLQGRFYRERLQNESVPIWMFKEARRLDRKAKLFLNDYNVITQGGRIQEYKDQASYLISKHCDVGGLGAEGHFSQYNPPEPTLLKARLDKLWQLKIPIWLTEVDVIDRIPGSRAEKLEYILRIGFSHPGVNGIILWGFWGGNHWAGEKASLWDKNWRINDAGIRLLSLKEEWNTTRVWHVVKDHPRYRFRGYHGSYVIRVISGNQSKEAYFDIVPGRGRQFVKINFSDFLGKKESNSTRKISRNDTSYIGCYKDGPRRAMDGFFYTDHLEMTIEKCLSECGKRDFLFAGLEWRYECFCGNSYTMYGRRNESWCNRPCTGNQQQVCGGGYSLSVYAIKQVKSNDSESDLEDVYLNVTSSNESPENFTSLSNEFGDNYTNSAENSTNDNVTRTRSTLLEDDPNVWTNFKNGDNTKVTYIGCFPDNDPPRALNGRQRYVTTKVTLQLCFNHCSGYKYAGLQNSMECYCGNSYDRYGSLPADQWKCNSPCAGNASDICGGIMHNSVYQRENYAEESTTLKGIYLGCWQDSLPKRTLQGSVLTSDSMTIDQCLTFCRNNDYVYAGLQFGMQCYCGNHYRSRQLPEINCNERCTGDASAFCGGSMANSVFNIQGFS